MNTRKGLLVVAFLFLLFSSTTAAPVFAAVTCESLINLNLPNTTITSSQLITTSPFQPPPSPDMGYGTRTYSPISGLPSFCRVTGSVKPTPESDVEFEVWMPVSGWNGRYQGVGNGVFWGSIQYSALAAGLLRGNAVSSTNAGHWGGNALWAVGHHQLLLDFANGFHYMAVASKPIIAAFYGTPAKYSYFTGCSAGGKQALWESQRYPEDYDGYLAGCPAHYESRLNWGHAWNGVGFLLDDGLSIGPGGIPEAKYPWLVSAVLAKCDSIDGLTDNLIQDPTKCDFDPASVQCTGADANTCLTAPQVSALKRFYGGPKNPRTGGQIFPGYPPGTDPLWYQYTPKGLGIAQFFQGMVFNDPTFNALHSDFDTDVARSDALIAGILDAMDPNYAALKTRGGKIMHWHALYDQNISPYSSTFFYNKVINAMGGLSNTQDFYRLYLAPGIRHCGGGPGPFNLTPSPKQDAQHDLQTALEQWVEQGLPPERVIASHTTGSPAVVDRTRPLCAYPEIAAYSGNGSIDDAANFTCVPPITVRIEPATLNLKSKGEFTVFITVPDGYDIRDWNMSDVSCQGASAVKGMVSADAYIAKFNRQDLKNVTTGDAVELLVNGTLHRGAQPALVQATGTTNVIK
jgi:feruloyl esterase